MSIFAINYDSKVVHVVGDTAQCDLDRRVVGFANKISANPVTGIGFCGQGIVKLHEAFRIWLEVDPDNHVETIEDVVASAPGFLQSVHERLVGEPDDSDDHQHFLVWGPNKAGAFRLYGLSSYDEFTPRFFPPGTYSLPKTGDESLPPKLNAVVQDLVTLVRFIYKWATEQEIFAGGGPLLYFQQTQKAHMFGKVGSLDEDPAAAPSAPEPNRTQRRAEEKRARKAARRTLH